MTILLAVVAVGGGLAGIFGETTLVATLVIAVATWCPGDFVPAGAGGGRGAGRRPGAARSPVIRSRAWAIAGCSPSASTTSSSATLAEDRPLSVVAIDLDGFNALNDTVGHAAGDELLRDAAAALVGVVRAGDVVVRQGGDEFCLVLIDTPAAEARHVGDAVRAALSAVQIDGRSLGGGVGAATCPADGTTRAELLEVADARLVQGKRDRRPET